MVVAAVATSVAPHSAIGDCVWLATITPFVLQPEEHVQPKA